MLGFALCRLSFPNFVLIFPFFEIEFFNFYFHIVFNFLIIISNNSNNLSVNWPLLAMLLHYLSTCLLAYLPMCLFICLSCLVLCFIFHIPIIVVIVIVVSKFCILWFLIIMGKINKIP